MSEAFEVLDDERVITVLKRLHAEADRQTPGLLLHYLPKLPSLVLGNKLRFRQEEAGTYYSDKYLALEREQAAFVYLLARGLGATRVVEFGTSFGVSTIWLAAAVRDNGGGRVIGTELVAEKAEAARRNVADAGLSQYVEILTGDARDTLAGVEGPIDMVLNDGFPTLALDIVQLLEPKLRTGAMVVTDNVGMFKGNYVEYLKYMRDPAHGYRSHIVPFKSGTEVSVFSPQEAQA